MVLAPYLKMIFIIMVCTNYVCAKFYALIKKCTNKVVRSSTIKICTKFSSVSKGQVCVRRGEEGKVVGKKTTQDGNTHYKMSMGYHS